MAKAAAQGTETKDLEEMRGSIRKLSQQQDQVFSMVAKLNDELSKVRADLERTRHELSVAKASAASYTGASVNQYR